MNFKQARRLERLFDDATPPPSPYHNDGDPLPTVHISVKYDGDDLDLHMLCPETTLVRFLQHLYITPDGVLCEYDDEIAAENDRDRMVPVWLAWKYRAESYTWEMVAKPMPVAERSAA
jgi:hypothetical protein